MSSAEKSEPEPGAADDIARMSFEEAMNELEGIVQRLESGHIDLEDSIEIYSRGMALKQHCEAKLKTAQSKIEKIVAGGDDSQPPETEPFDVD